MDRGGGAGRLTRAVGVALHLRTITVGAYAGGDLTGGMGWTGGGVVGIALPDWLERAEVRRAP